MAALDFPDSPVTGDLYGSAGTLWRWDGARWASTAGASGARGAVAYAQIVSNIAGYTTTVTDIYGLSVTFVADPTRRYKTTLYINCWSATGNDSLLGHITTGAGAGLAAATVFQGAFGNQGRYVMVERIETGLSGAQTRKGMFQVSGTGPATIGASAANPCFILVEDITYEAGSAGGSGIPSPPAAAVSPNNAACSSASYIDIGGPSVSVITGTSALVTLSCAWNCNTAGGTGFMGVAVSGASTIPAPNTSALSCFDSEINNTSDYARQIVITGLTPGLNTFKAMNACNSAGIFSKAVISVQAL